MTERISKLHARKLWMRAQCLDREEPLGSGPHATQSAIEHLGYVQIDTINVIERCHHHILFSRIPKYKRSDLHRAVSEEKSVFEYWTHALSFVPTRDFRFFMRDMKRVSRAPGPWLAQVKRQELLRVLRLIEKNGALSIRDIDDDVLIEKSHPWASRKPSKKALQLGFYSGRLTVSERIGMLKKYELTKRHFNWSTPPRPASEPEILDYLLDRSLRAQGLVSLDSICHLDARRKPAVHKLIERRVRKGKLLAVQVEGIEKMQFWMAPELLEEDLESDSRVHLLSPFDPLIIQRKRLSLLFNYEHRFEAYVPKAQRVLGYFALPVLVGNEVVAAIDLKADRAHRKLIVQQWTWINRRQNARLKPVIEDEMHRFACFQFES